MTHLANQVVAQHEVFHSVAMVHNTEAQQLQYKPLHRRRWLLFPDGPAVQALHMIPLVSAGEGDIRCLRLSGFTVDLAGPVLQSPDQPFLLSAIESLHSHGRKPAQKMVVLMKAATHEKHETKAPVHCLSLRHFHVCKTHIPPAKGIVLGCLCPR